MAIVNTLYLAIACLLVPVFAEYAKIRKNAEKAFNWIAIGGVSFILATAFGVSFWTTIGAETVTTYGGLIFEFVGWIFVLIGALLAIVEIIKK